MRQHPEPVVFWRGLWCRSTFRPSSAVRPRRGAFGCLANRWRWCSTAELQPAAPLPASFSQMVGVCAWVCARARVWMYVWVTFPLRSNINAVDRFIFITVRKKKSRPLTSQICRLLCMSMRNTLSTVTTTFYRATYHLWPTVWMILIKMPNQFPGCSRVRFYFDISACNTRAFLSVFSLPMTLRMPY